MGRKLGSPLLHHMCKKWIILERTAADSEDQSRYFESDCEVNTSNSSDIL